jgi:hypothetical protein
MATAVGCMKSLLLKTPHTLLTGNGDIKLGLEPEASSLLASIHSSGGHCVGFQGTVVTNGPAPTHRPHVFHY